MDEKGEFQGEEEKEKCHLGDGLLHKAFLAMVFNDKGELMLAQRSRRKPLWPLYWDGTVASHYQKDQDPLETVKRRCIEEIGVACGRLELLFTFQYQARYLDIGSENELCDVYKARLQDVRKLAPRPEEIAAYEFSSVSHLKGSLARNKPVYTPWFVLAIGRYGSSAPRQITKRE